MAAPHIFIRTSCTGCGNCAAICPNDALVICGEKRPAADLFNELVRDIAYFRRSGGGITFSGGECLLYPDYLAEILKYCGEAGIDTAVETSLAVPWGHIKKVLSGVSRFLVDCKHMDAARHREYTGCGNELILHNLALLAAHHTNILIRIPLIPSVNDDTGNLAAAVKMACRLRYAPDNPAGGVRGVELLKYNPYGLSKYAELGRQGTAYAGDPQEDAEMENLCDSMNETAGVRGFVFFS
jgi:pyruvate formate lyase activating enzyme